MNPKLFNMIQKLNTNSCTGRFPVPNQKKAQMSKSKFKAMMIVFFNIQGTIHIDQMAEDQTINQIYYSEDFKASVNRLGEKYPKCGKTVYGYFMKTMHQYTKRISVKI